MLKKTKSPLFLLFLFAVPLFSHEANIEIEGENRYKSVRLIPQVYNAAHCALSDLLIKNSGENVPYFINSSVGKTNETEETYFIESFTPEFTVETQDKTTRILIEGLKNLRLCDLQIETDSMFIRKARASRGIEKELYNLSINGTTYTDTVLPLNRRVSESDIFTVSISDGDDEPVNITGIIVRYYADDLVFQGNAGGVYRLEFGADLSRAAPVYDIERYKNEILKGPIDRLVLGEIVYVQTEPAREIIIPKIVFNIVVTVIGILLAVLIIFKLKK
jgi:hypothetical protein